MAGPGFEEVLFTTRAMRRMRPDPVPEAELRWLIEAATQAASAQNSQTWAFIVVTDAGLRRRMAEAYRRLAEEAVKPGADGSMGLPEHERKVWAHAYEFGKRFHEVPALIVCCMRAKHPDSPLLGSSFYGSIYVDRAGSGGYSPEPWTLTSSTPVARPAVAGTAVSPAFIRSISAPFP